MKRTKIINYKWLHLKSCSSEFGLTNYVRHLTNRSNFIRLGRSKLQFGIHVEFMQFGIMWNSTFEVGLKWLPTKLRNSNNIIIFLSFISQKSNGMGASKIKDQCATRAISSAFETRNIISYRESSCHERWMKKKF